MSNILYASVIMELQNQQPIATYTYGDDLISYHQGTGSQYYLYDALGSTRALTNENGQITDSYNYDAFGANTEHQGTSNNKYQYAGEQKDVTGNYYLRARYYNPSIGRFTQMDSYMGQSNNPITLHKYLYANANPVMYTDPSGYMFSLSGIMTAQNLSTTMRYYNFASLAFDGTKALASGSPQGAATMVASEIVFGKLGRFGPVNKMSDQVVNFFASVWSRGIKLRLGKEYSSDHLKHNMEQVFGQVIPSDYRAHHIVPRTSPAMNILKKHNIDPNSVSNGVALPFQRNTGSLAAHHNGRHCAEYYRYVERILERASHDKVEVLNALSLIRGELLSGAALLQECR